MNLKTCKIEMEPKISTGCFVSSLHISVLRSEIISLLEPNALSLLLL